MEKTNKELEQQIKKISEQCNKEFARHRKELRGHKILINALVKMAGDISIGKEPKFPEAHVEAIKQYEGFEGSAKSDNGEIFP